MAELNMQQQLGPKLDQDRLAQMIDTALAQPQLKHHHRPWWSLMGWQAPMAAVTACVLLLLVGTALFPMVDVPGTPPINLSSNNDLDEDDYYGDLNELIILSAFEANESYSQ